MKTIYLTLKEGGPLWQVVVPDMDTVKHILNTGKYNGTQIYALMLEADMIYDFVLKEWR